MKLLTTVRIIRWKILITLIITCYMYVPAQEIILENDTLKVTVENSSGCFSVTEKVTGQIWQPDPWEHSAALLTLKSPSGTQEILNLSKSSTVQVKKIDDDLVQVKFSDPVLADGSIAKGITISTELQLQKNSAVLIARVKDVNSSSGYELIELRYPARHFSLRTDQDRGAGVIPQWQGVICPSYIFPMTGGRFCQWDDAVYDERSYGSLSFYNFNGGLSMPWFGTYNEKSAVIGILAKEPSASMEYIINNNGQYSLDPKGVMSTYPRILALTPIWNLTASNPDHQIEYNFIPKGNYVQMAKCYRKIAMQRGYFVTLKEKARLNPNVNKLAGALYLGLYGGYPHYVNMPGMAFNFKQLQDIIQDVHDNLKVKNAFIHAWGTFSNYVPNNWPISEELGGVEELKKAVSIAKDFGYLYSSYHAYSPRLEHDPDYNTDLLPRKADGSLQLGGRWNRVDPKFYYDLAHKNLPKELEAIGQNADVTDILFISTPTEGHYKLAKYLRSLNLVMGTERGQEHYIPYFDLFEGMTYYYSVENGIPLATISQPAPLFNLVYHDAIGNFGKIQDPDNDITFQGDFKIKSLRNILFGNGTLLFPAPYEYDGMREMIRMSNELVLPVHKETFFEELIEHEYLSADFKVQRSKFSNGTEVWVNLGPVNQKLSDGETISGYGFKVKYQNGEIAKGNFNTSLNYSKEQ